MLVWVRLSTLLGVLGGSFLLAASAWFGGAFALLALAALATGMLDYFSATHHLLSHNPTLSIPPTAKATQALTVLIGSAIAASALYLLVHEE